MKPTPPIKSYTQSSDYTEPVKGVCDLFGLYFRGAGFSTWASFWALWNGGVTAAHCIDETRGWSPAHPTLGAFPSGFEPVSTLAVDAAVIRQVDGGYDEAAELWLDAALAGVSLPAEPPLKPEAGMRVKVYGFPAACTRQVEVRRGYLYLERIAWNDEARRYQLSWIIVFDDDMVPVSGGMSGGLVVHAPECAPGDADYHPPRASEVPIGITITLNSAANLDDDAHLEDGMDMTPLYHVWAAQTGRRMGLSAGPWSPLALIDDLPQVVDKRRAVDRSDLAPGSAASQRCDECGRILAA